MDGAPAAGAVTCPGAGNEYPAIVHGVRGQPMKREPMRAAAKPG